MTSNIILASKSEVRKKILNKNGINCEVIPANVDEDQVKESLIKDKATPLLISKNLDSKYFKEVNDLVSTINCSEKIILVEDSGFLPAIYNNAELYIFSSYCEVFGFTNLEAMSCGLPVLTSNKSALPEICGDAALYFNPHDPIDIANKISNLFFNDKLKE